MYCHTIPGLEVTPHLLGCLVTLVLLQFHIVSIYVKGMLGLKDSIIYFGTVFQTSIDVVKELL